MSVGSMATVWDVEIAGMRLALESFVTSLVLVLSDFQTVIAFMRNAARCGMARMTDLREVVDMVRVWTSAGVPIWFACVKAHVGVAGNEAADMIAKARYKCEDPPLVTEEGIRALWKGFRAMGRWVAGCGRGNVVQWG